MVKTRMDFRCPDYYNLHMVCHTHGWINLGPFSWDYSSGSLNLAILDGKSSFDLSFHQESDTIKASIFSHKKIDLETNKRLREKVIRCLSLNVDISGLLDCARDIGPEYVELIKNGAGRLLRSPTLWEDAAKTLFTTNCSWKLTQKMCIAMCSEKFVLSTPLGSFTFPTPGLIARYSSEKLKELIPVGYRCGYLKSLAERFAEDPYLQNLEQKKIDYPKANSIVNEINGFGPYACAHILLLAAYYNEIPIDTVIVSYLKTTYQVQKPKLFIEKHYRKWGEYKWWGLKLEIMIRGCNWIGG